MCRHAATGSVGRRIAFASALVLLLSPNATRADPYIPASDGEIVAKLPRSFETKKARAFQTLIRQQPENLGLAVAAAKLNLDLAESESDPRYIGHAEAALAPWWSLKNPPIEVLLLRASILQSRHEFDSAVEDLTKVITLDPKNAQAFLSRAVIQQVRGHFAEARKDCASLAELRPGLVSVTCGASINSLTGRGVEALDVLNRALTNGRKLASRPVVLWALTVLAETAERQGRVAMAETYFLEAFTLGIKDGYLVTAYADFLLVQSRPAEVIALLKDRTTSDPFLLRLAEAERQLGIASWRTHAADLETIFAIAAARGDTVHRREEARFMLHIRGNAVEALRLARANWAVQNEPADALILLEAALIADRAAAEPVLTWISQTELRDVRIERVVQKLQAAK